jgi:hypothetical protein
MGSELEAGGKKGNISVSDIRAVRESAFDKVVSPVIFPFGFAKKVCSAVWVVDVERGPVCEGRLR